ncbi:MAG: SET domain-containing protein-lysine N-methyltransferase [Bacteroidetes bacterium]|nr:MAG: SET domain-containing protein-lysine N-methyltransferase [Bacteroidota bacterium]TAF96410.1 MAG: SET domain-containing protein-lysine N-methyltransferase [Bacteroidota bacterium]
MQVPFIYIAPSDKGGRGVFTNKNIPAGTTIEVSPVLILSAKDRKAIEQTKLYHYIFEWGKTRKQGAVAWGYVSMYNHSYAANCDYDMDFELETMSIKTVRAIKKGEELTVNYNATPDDETPIWFHQQVK